VTSFAAGRISGFGSIIVNDVHYDETAASIVDDDGVSHRPDELQLGMTVQIEAGPVTRDAAGLSISIASKILFGTEIRGPIERVDPTAGTLRVLGQTGEGRHQHRAGRRRRRDGTPCGRHRAGVCLLRRVRRPLHRHAHRAPRAAGELQAARPDRPPGHGDEDLHDRRRHDRLRIHRAPPTCRDSRKA
jgi:hypothetical protein